MIPVGRVLAGLVGLGLALWLASCAPHARPGSYRREALVGVESVETVWWYVEQRCDLWIRYAGGPTGEAGRWVRDVNADLWCHERRRR